MTGLTLTRIIELLERLTGLTATEICELTGIPLGSYKHWKYDNIRPDDPPRKLVEAFAKITGIPAWKIYHAYFTGDEGLLTTIQDSDLERLQLHPLYEGTTTDNLYIAVSFARTARSLRQHQRFEDALAYFGKALTILEHSNGVLLRTYIRLHALEAHVLLHGLEMTRAVYAQARTELSTALRDTPAQKQARHQCIEQLNVRAKIEWFILSSGSDHTYESVDTASELLHLALDRNLYTRIPYLYLHMARCYVDLREHKLAKEKTHAAEQAAYALRHPSLNDPIWFLDAGETLPNGELDFSWHETDVRREKAKLLQEIALQQEGSGRIA